MDSKELASHKVRTRNMRMDESSPGVGGKPPQTEDGTASIELLLASDAYHAIRNLALNVNCFEILDTAVAPESWLKFLGFLFDSRAEHALGQRFFRAWMECLDLQGWEQARPFVEGLPSAEGTYTRVHKYWLKEGRFLETLVEVVGKNDQVVAALGIKNKHGSGDDHDELRDLQAHLMSSYPSVPKLIIAVEGYQREKMDVHGEVLVPVIHQSVRTLVNAAIRMDGVADATVDWLLACFIEYLEKRLLGVNRMSNQARQLVRELYTNSEHRTALRHICRFTPTQRGVYDRMQFRIKQAIEKMPKPEAPQGSVIYSYYPQDHISPKEMKIEFIELNFRSERHGAWVVYVLDANTTEPDIGDEITLRIMAWWNDENAKKLIDAMNLRNHLPASQGPLEGWSNWEPIWVGKSHHLTDLGDQDVAALSEIVADAVRRTFGTIRERMYAVVKE